VATKRSTDLELYLNCNFGIVFEIYIPFLRTGCQDREYSFAEVFLLFFVTFFILFFIEKVCYLGSKYFFPDLAQLEILQSLGGLYDELAFYPLHWS